MRPAPVLHVSDSCSSSPPPPPAFVMSGNFKGRCSSTSGHHAAAEQLLGSWLKETRENLNEIWFLLLLFLAFCQPHRKVTSFPPSCHDMFEVYSGVVERRRRSTAGSCRFTSVLLSLRHLKPQNFDIISSFSGLLPSSHDDLRDGLCLHGAGPHKA